MLFITTHTPSSLPPVVLLKDAVSRNLEKTNVHLLIVFKGVPSLKPRSWSSCNIHVAKPWWRAGVQKALKVFFLLKHLLAFGRKRCLESSKSVGQATERLLYIRAERLDTWAGFFPFLSIMSVMLVSLEQKSAVYMFYTRFVKTNSFHIHRLEGADLI